MIGWIRDNITALIIGTVTGVIASLLCSAAKSLCWYIKTCKSEYSGTWQQLIYHKNDIRYTGDPQKIDTYHIKHKKLKYSGTLNQNFTGTISRCKPTNEAHRKWDVSGYLDGDVLTMLYQSKEGQKSRGCIYVKLCHQDGQDDFRGFYLEEHKDGSIDKTPLILRKIDNR